MSFPPTVTYNGIGPPSALYAMAFVVQYDFRGKWTVADIRQLIEKIVSDPKIANSGNFADKVYRDEPILITAPQMEKYTPPEIREMRKIARESWSEAKIFHEQGMFMESFEDTFDYRGEFSQYFPTYQAMSDAQLRGYFSWRAKVRNGDVGKTSISFAFVYIYELLNQIGVQSPEDGFHALKNFWTAYRGLDPRIDSYVGLWLKDYVVYYNLDKSLLDGLSDSEFDNAVTVLLEYKSHGMEEVFSALNALSSYNLEESKFFSQHPDDVRNVVYRVFTVVSEYYNRNPKNSAREKLFGRMVVNPYAMFRSAVFYHRISQEDRVYELGPHQRYACKNGLWQCERFFWFGHNNKRIGALLKTIDYFMRQAYGYKSALQPGKTNKVLKGKIEKEIAKYEQWKLDSAPPKIDIDISRLHSIRTAALAIQTRLLVDAPEEDAPPAAVDIAAETPGPRRGPALNDLERQFLQRLLDGEQYDDLIRSRGVLPSVLIDGINEKLFDLFNDTVVVDAGGGPELLEDYREDVKGMIAR